MAFPSPIFALADWSTVWVFPTIMAVAFGVFMVDRGVVANGARRPLVQRVLSYFILYASVWIPFQIFGDAIERGAEAQGFNAPEGWGFGVGLASGVIVFLALLAVAARVKPVQQWLGYDRNPFKSASKS